MGDISQQGLDLIKKWEAFFPNAYDDGEGVWTIGWGTTRWDLKTPVKQGDAITVDEAERQLRKECQRVEDAVDATVKVPLTQPEYDALVSLFYNIGIGWCTGEGHQQASFIKELNRGNYTSVPAGILKFVRGANTGKAYAGLLNRRKDEAKLWLSTPDEAAARPPVVEEDTPPIAQAVAPDRPSVVTTVKESPTIWASFVAMVSTIGGGLSQGYEWIFGVAREAGPEVLALKTTISPFDALLKLTPAVLLMITVAAISYVVIRKINKR